MKIFRRQKDSATPAPADKTVLLEDTFGSELSEKLTSHLGAEGAAELAETMVAEAKQRFSKRVQDFLTEEEREEVSRKILDSDVYKIAEAAAFYSEAMAEKAAEQVASEAITKTGLPPDLKLDLGARIYLVLIPMRMGTPQDVE